MLSCPVCKATDLSYEVVERTITNYLLREDGTVHQESKIVDTLDVLDEYVICNECGVKVSILFSSWESPVEFLDKEE